MNHTRWNKLLLAASIFVAAACSPQTEQPVAPADIIFIGDNIITMDDASATGVAVNGDRIVATGSASDILTLKGEETRLVELGDNALLPGFIDAHGHIGITARLIDYANVSSPPVGPVETIEDLQNLLRDFIDEKEIPAGEWVVGYGYDESLLAEQRHPTRVDLDAVSTDHPILLIHVSAHLAAVNSATLAAHGIDATTPEPAGGRIRRWPGTNEPNGVLEETAAQAITFGRLAADTDDVVGKVRRAMEHYASYGITTAQEGATLMSDVAEIRASAAITPLPMDLVAYPLATILTEEQREAIAPGQYENGFRIGGVKFILDGSIQGKTGYLSQPYLKPPEGMDADYRAYPMIEPETFQALLTPLAKRGVPVLVHANGDAAIDMMIDGIDEAFAGANMPDHRSVMIHAQIMREDQLDRIKTLGIVPSYFSAHPFFWGDWHRQILGETRASQISPIRSTINRDIPFTIHNDTPIVPPDMMRLLWVTVNRETRSGYVLGPDQRASVMEALNAITQGAAYQYFEEDKKGSITVGKQADFVILGANPLTVAPDTLKDIAIVETIAKGQTIYRKE